MLTIYSTNGSPGASTLAVYLSAVWAAAGKETLLIEADAAPGSLARKLGMQVSPGTASFFASDKPADAEHLIEHSQDVLFNTLHVMPAPANPTGAAACAEKLELIADRLRDIADGETAVIIDAGRLSAASAASQFVAHSAAVLVVSSDETEVGDLPELDRLSEHTVAEADEAGPLGLSLSFGESPLSEDEWAEQWGFRHVGSLAAKMDGTAELAMFVERGKRKSRKLRAEIEGLAARFEEFAHPGGASSPRPRRQAPPRPPEEAGADPGAAAESSAAPEKAAPAGAGSPDPASDAPTPPHPAAPPHPAEPPSPDTGWGAAAGAAPAGGSPAVPPPAPAYPPQAPPGYPPQAPPGYPPQPGHPLPPQAPPGYPPQAPSGYPPQVPSGYPPQPGQPVPPQAPPGYPPQPPVGYPPSHGVTSGQAPAHHAPPALREVGGAEPPAEPEPPPPTGSFRSWAGQLYDVAPAQHDEFDPPAGRPGTA